MTDDEEYFCKDKWNQHSEDWRYAKYDYRQWVIACKHSRYQPSQFVSTSTKNPPILKSLSKYLQERYRQ